MDLKTVANLLDAKKRMWLKAKKANDRTEVKRLRGDIVRLKRYFYGDNPLPKTRPADGERVLPGCNSCGWADSRDSASHSEP